MNRIERIALGVLFVMVMFALLLPPPRPRRPGPTMRPEPMPVDSDGIAYDPARLPSEVEDYLRSRS
jgi:hypothetical protein